MPSGTTSGSRCVQSGGFSQLSRRVVSLWAAWAIASTVRAEPVEAFKDPLAGSGRTDKTGTTALCHAVAQSQC